MAKIVGGNQELVLEAGKRVMETSLFVSDLEEFMANGKFFGLIPFNSEDMDTSNYQDHPFTNSLIGDEGEFGDNDEYYLGLQDIYVRKNEKVWSGYYEDKGIGFLLVILA